MPLFAKVDAQCKISKIGVSFSDLPQSSHLSTNMKETNTSALCVNRPTACELTTILGTMVPQPIGRQSLVRFPKAQYWT